MSWLLGPDRSTERVFVVCREVFMDGAVFTDWLDNQGWDFWELAEPGGAADEYADRGVLIRVSKRKNADIASLSRTERETH
jgi:hypothetical protein